MGREIQHQTAYRGVDVGHAAGNDEGDGFNGSVASQSHGHQGARVRALRKLAHELGRRVELQATRPGFCIQHQLGIGVGTPPQPAATQPAGRRWSRICRRGRGGLLLRLPRGVALGRFFVELAADGPQHGLASGFAFLHSLLGLLGLRKRSVLARCLHAGCFHAGGFEARRFKA